MIWALIVSAAAVAIVALALALGRARVQSRRRFETALERVDEHMLAISRQLERSVERSLAAGARDTSALPPVLDLETLLGHVAREAASRSTASAAAVRVQGAGDDSVYAFFGDARDGALLDALPSPPDAGAFRAVTIDWSYGAADRTTFKSALVVPIVEEGVPAGAVAVYGLTPHAFGPEHALALQSLADEVADGVTNARRYARLERRATIDDEVAGVRNRRGYEDELDREVARARRTGRPLSLLVLDVDMQSGSEPAGDPEAHGIAALGRLLVGSSRATDVVGRAASHEFALLLPETTTTGAGVVLSRLRSEIEVHRGPRIASAGVVAWRSNDTAESLHARARGAMTRMTAGVLHDPTEYEEARDGSAAVHPTLGPLSPGSRGEFFETLGREVSSARAESRRLSLLLLEAGSPTGSRRGQDQDGSDQALDALAVRVSERIPESGRSWRIEERELAVILAATTADAAERLFADLRGSIADRPLPGDRSGVSAGITELANNDDSQSLFGRAQLALAQAAEAGPGTVVVATVDEGRALS